MGIAHDRLDAILNWTVALQVENTCQAEFDALRKQDKISRRQLRRISHLERHLDIGDLICECYEKCLPV